jgi:transcriptional regulator with XRE-family HTH domain
VTVVAAGGSAVGGLLREWRRRRRRSQLELALDAGVSTRHLSFVETGRARPSAELVLALATALEVPLRERNELLLAAGYAPRYAARSLEDPELAAVRDAVGRVLDAHEPFPAIAVDRHWDLVASNGALDPLLAGVDPALLEPPANALRIALHPAGMAPRILNLAEYRAHLLERLLREARVTADPTLAELLDELAGYPSPAPPPQAAPAARAGARVASELMLASPDGGAPLVFFSTITTFGTAVDVTVSELAVEAFFPADARTTAALGPGDDGNGDPSDARAPVA